MRVLDSYHQHQSSLSISPHFSLLTPHAHNSQYLLLATGCMPLALPLSSPLSNPSPPLFPLHQPPHLTQRWRQRLHARWCMLDWSSQTDDTSAGREGQSEDCRSSRRRSAKKSAGRSAQMRIALCAACAGSLVYELSAVSNRTLGRSTHHEITLSTLLICISHIKIV